MTLIIPDRSVGHPPDRMPGIEKVVFVRADGNQWIARLFTESGKSIASGAAYGDCIAEGLYLAIQDHNGRQT